MNEIAIRVQNLTKVYKLYEKPSNRLREVFHPLRKKYHRDFAALKDLSFEIEKGQVIGIIGKNGSGKSTLLKILTGVLTPSSGKVEVNGRIAALLELGAGFNPELTGRENIYLNGALMGYSHKQMDQRIQNIIEFADIGEFIEQPVKMYSSGMFVRLAFAVAANVDPDILIVDEALSVGDVRFQMKCIRKMRSFVELGKTVVFVSHDTAIINSFCSRCIWIDNGKLIDDGNSGDVIKRYTAQMAYSLSTDIEKEPTRELNDGYNKNWALLPVDCESFGLGGAKIVGYKLIERSSQNAISQIAGGEQLEILLKIEVMEALDSPGVGIILNDRLGRSVLGIGNYIYNVSFDEWTPGVYIVSVAFEIPYLQNGTYSFSAAISDGTQHTHEQHHWVHDLLQVRVESNDLKQQIGNLIALVNKVEIKSTRV